MDDQVITIVLVSKVDERVAQISGGSLPGYSDIVRGLRNDSIHQLQDYFCLVDSWYGFWSLLETLELIFTSQDNATALEMSKPAKSA